QPARAGAGGPSALGDRAAIPGAQNGTRARSLRRTVVPRLAASRGHHGDRLRLSAKGTHATARRSAPDVAAGPRDRAGDLYGPAVHQPAAVHALDATSGNPFPSASDLE